MLQLLFDDFGLDHLYLIGVFAHECFFFLMSSLLIWWRSCWRHGYIHDHELACFQSFNLNRRDALLEVDYLFKNLAFLSQVLRLRSLEDEWLEIIVSIPHLSGLYLLCVLIIVQCIIFNRLLLLVIRRSSSFLLLLRRNLHGRRPKCIHLLQLFISFRDLSQLRILVLIKLDAIFRVSIR